MSDTDFAGMLQTIRDRGEPVTVQALLNSFTSQPPKERARGRTLRSAAQLLDDVGELPPMLIDDFLPDRSLFLLAGKPKAGKSFLALDIADAVCRGTPALGRYAVNRAGPVVYVGMEDGEIEIAKRLKQRGLSSGDKRLLYYITDSFILTDPDNLADFRAEVEAMSPSLIVIDTAAEALGIRDWLNRGEIIEKVAPIRRLAREVCSVLLVAHNRKAEGDGGDEIAGSNAFAGAVDGWISAQRIERRPNGNRRMFLRVEGRGGVRGEIAVEMDTATLGFSVVSADQLETEALKSTPQTNFSHPRFVQLKRAIADLGDSATVAAIASACRISRKTAGPLVSDLVQAGQVQQTGRHSTPGAFGPKAATYRLSTAESSHPSDRSNPSCHPTTQTSGAQSCPTE